jgi:hypothetical protein
MKLQPLIVGVVGAVVLAPGAIGAVDRAVGTGQVTKHPGISASHGRTKAGGSLLKLTVPSVPLYVYQPAPLEVPAVDPAYACATEAIDCELQEACDLWGVSCDQIVAPATAPDGAVEASSTAPAAAGNASTAAGG